MELNGPESMIYYQLGYGSQIENILPMLLSNFALHGKKMSMWWCLVHGKFDYWFRLQGLEGIRWCLTHYRHEN